MTAAFPDNANGPALERRAQTPKEIKLTSPILSPATIERAEELFNADGYVACAVPWCIGHWRSEVDWSSRSAADFDRLTHLSKSIDLIGDFEQPSTLYRFVVDGAWQTDSNGLSLNVTVDVDGDVPIADFDRFLEGLEGMVRGLREVAAEASKATAP